MLKVPSRWSFRTVISGFQSKRLFSITTGVRLLTEQRESFTLLALENCPVPNLIQALQKLQKRYPALSRMRAMYGEQPSYPRMSDFRIGPSPFEEIPLDWLILLLSTNECEQQLIGHGITTRIFWNGKTEHLPKGWQGTIRQVRENLLGLRRVPNTLVGLFIRIEKEHRKGGWAGKTIYAMKDLQRRSKLPQLIIPLRLPMRFTPDYIRMPYDEFAALRREDGEYLDHWLRLHTRLGAKVLCTEHHSHQHALNVDDLTKHYQCPEITQSGNYLVEQNGECFEALVNLERDFAVLNQECVWIEHTPLENSDQA